MPLKSGAGVNSSDAAWVDCQRRVGGQWHAAAAVEVGQRAFGRERQVRDRQAGEPGAGVVGRRVCREWVEGEGRAVLGDGEGVVEGVRRWRTVECQRGARRVAIHVGERVVERDAAGEVGRRRELQRGRLGRGDLGVQRHRHPARAVEVGQAALRGCRQAREGDASRAGARVVIADRVERRRGGVLGERHGVGDCVRRRRHPDGHCRGGVLPPSLSVTL